MSFFSIISDSVDEISKGLGSIPSPASSIRANTTAWRTIREAKRYMAARTKRLQIHRGTPPNLQHTKHSPNDKSHSNTEEAQEEEQMECRARASGDEVRRTANVHLVIYTPPFYVHCSFA